MNAERLTELIVKLTSIPSVTLQEREVLLHIEGLLEARGLKIERIPVEENRWNIFVTVGTPKTVLSTHVDVVPAPPALFKPRIENGKIYARGSCDAKGIAACMIAAFFRLLDAGKTDIALLFVVGEELGGLGAEIATKHLAKRGIKYLINGEPTESKLAKGHKGFMLFELTVPGLACHSGYPELGVDANRKLIELCSAIYATDFGHNELFGPATTNLGIINGGVAPNIVSPHAKITGAIRLVSGVDEQLAKLKALLPSDVRLEILQSGDPVELKVLPGFETYIAAYGTDVAHFRYLEGVECLMYGPGSILVAHTDGEFLEIEAAMKAVDVYVDLVERLN